MPRKGPPKSTSRGDRDNERKDEARLRQIKEIKSVKEEEALKKYDSESRPDMPKLAADQRVLRRALIGRDENLLRCGDTGVKREDLMPRSEPLGSKYRGEIRGVDTCRDNDD